MFNLVLLAGQFSNPDAETLAIIMKLYLFTPVAILVNLIMLFRPSLAVRESSIAVITAVLGIAILVLGMNVDPVGRITAQFGLAIVAVFSNAVMRLRFQFALAVSVVLTVGEIVFISLDSVQSDAGRALGMGLTCTMLFFTLVANYSHNRGERINFLLCRRGDHLVDGLSRMNNILKQAAEQDGLTGLANRRAFDRRIADIWQRSTDRGLVLAVILIDIDHFKRLNDTFGHLYGDRVLRRVGRLLQESLRKKEDFAARFGGEEFIILLPGTETENALLVAERLRHLVEVAGLPAPEDGSSLKGAGAATVSCGVAAGSPLQFESLQSFLEAADKALYRAKAFGRNSVCVSPESQPRMLAAG